MKVGVAGIGRGLCLRDGLEHSGAFRVTAVCDLSAGQRDAVRTKPEYASITEVYETYDEMLAASDLDVAVIATPMDLHVPMSIAALEKGLHVISEVTAAVSLEQCRDLVAACKISRGTYIMAENAPYVKENALVTELVRAGLFGSTYYAEGEYLHRIRGTAAMKPWRRQWTYGINGVTYGSHELGAPLTWMAGDRVVSVCCAGSGHHFNDAAGKPFEAEATCTMLCKMPSGGLVKIRQDIQSNRPHATTNFALQGTEGCYESARWPEGTHRVWLRARSGDEQHWTDLREFEDEFLPDIYKDEVAQQLYEHHFHRGSDFFMAYAIAEMLQGKRPNTLGIHEAMDMTLPGLVSQQSIAEGGKWTEVPDSRDW